MEKMIVCHAHNAQDRDHEKEKQAFRGRLFENENQSLHDMEGICGDAEYAAACEHLHICIVIHVRKDPVFDMIRPIGRDGRTEADAENRRAQKIFHAGFPDLPAPGIVHAALDVMAEDLPQFIGKDNAQDHGGRYANQIENTHKTDVPPLDAEKDHACKERGRPHQNGGAAEREHHAPEHSESENIVKYAEFVLIRKIEAGRHEHGQHTADIVAHAPAEHEGGFIDGTVFDRTVEKKNIGKLYKDHRAGDDEDAGNVLRRILFPFHRVVEINIKIHERKGDGDAANKIRDRVTAVKYPVQNEHGAHGKKSPARLRARFEYVSLPFIGDHTENGGGEDQREQAARRDQKIRPVEIIGRKRRLRRVALAHTVYDQNERYDQRLRIL